MLLTVFDAFSVMICFEGAGGDFGVLAAAFTGGFDCGDGLSKDLLDVRHGCFLTFLQAILPELMVGLR